MTAAPNVPAILTDNPVLFPFSKKNNRILFSNVGLRDVTNDFSRILRTKRLVTIARHCLFFFFPEFTDYLEVNGRVFSRSIRLAHRRLLRVDLGGVDAAPEEFVIGAIHHGNVFGKSPRPLSSWNAYGFFF